MSVRCFEVHGIVYTVDDLANDPNLLPDMQRKHLAVGSGDGHKANFFITFGGTSLPIDEKAAQLQKFKRCSRASAPQNCSRRPRATMSTKLFGQNACIPPQEEISWAAGEKGQGKH
jgi:hypothetical protein